jgi:hypothetical protein
MSVSSDDFASTIKLSCLEIANELSHCIGQSDFDGIEHHFPMDFPSAPEAFMHSSQFIFILFCLITNIISRNKDKVPS